MPRGFELRTPGWGLSWRRGLQRSRGCGLSRTRHVSIRGGSCGSRSWRAGCAWTAATRGLLLRRSGPGRRRPGGPGSSQSGSGGRTAGPAGSLATRGRGRPGTRTRVSGRRGSAGAVPLLRYRAGRGGASRGAAVGAGHRRGGRPAGDGDTAAWPVVPVLRNGHVRGAAADRASGRGVLRSRVASVRELGRGFWSHRLRRRFDLYDYIRPGQLIGRQGPMALLMPDDGRPGWNNSLKIPRMASSGRLVQGRRHRG